MSDDNELAELLWENGQAVVHGLIDPPQPAFRPFGTGSSAVQEKHSGGDSNNMMAFTKAGSIFGGMGMAPSLHNYASGLRAIHEKGDDDTVPWIHYPITENDDNTGPADYCSDFFLELQEAVATANLGSLPPSPNHHATNSSRGAVASSSRSPSEEIHSLSTPTIQTSQTQSHVEFAAAKQRQPSGSGEGVMNFSFFTRPAALARATLQSGHVFANQRAVWPQPKEERFTSAAALAVTVGNLQQGMAREKSMVATSSVCSGNNEPWHQHQHQQKRKVHSERSAYSAYGEIGYLQDADDEFDALLRSASRSMKRSRNTEAHNLSERVRRPHIPVRSITLGSIDPLDVP